MFASHAGSAIQPCCANSMAVIATRAVLDTAIKWPCFRRLPDGSGSCSGMMRRRRRGLRSFSTDQKNPAKPDAPAMKPAMTKATCSTRCSSSFISSSQRGSATMCSCATIAVPVAAKPKIAIPMSLRRLNLTFPPPQTSACSDVVRRPGADGFPSVARKGSTPGFERAVARLHDRWTVQATGWRPA